MPDQSPIHSQGRTPKRVKRLAYLLDSAIPLPGGRSIGLDAVVGLIPGVGDVVGALASFYIIAEGVRMGAPKQVVARMIGNVLLESTVGAIPVVGDLFDMVYKSNIRNIAMLVELEDLPRVPVELNPHTRPDVTDHDRSVVSPEKANNRVVLWGCTLIAMVLIIAFVWLAFLAVMSIAKAIF